jgi:hypothetical protein
MTLLGQIAERLERSVSAAIATDDSRWDYDFVMNVMDSVIASAKIAYVEKYRKIPGEWMYAYQVNYDETIQDTQTADDGSVIPSCYKKFPVPNAIRFKQGFSAINIGTRAGEFMRKYNSWTELNAMSKHELFRNKKGVLISGNSAFVWSSMDIDAIFVEACVANLTDLETFNPDFDDYRVTEDILVMAEDIMNKKYLIYMAQRRPDLVSDSKDVPSQQMAVK